MDIENFWSTVQFTPLYKDQGAWVMTATVDSGTLLQLRVVSKNKATLLQDMQWFLIYGTTPQEKERIQHFSMYHDLDKVLNLISENRTARVYRHKWDPVTITVQLDPDVVDMYVSEDSCRLAEVICKPTFTIKKER
jgi:hypothetical protein